MPSEMPPDLPSGPDAPPSDELASAEATLSVLQNVLHPIANDDWPKQTPCREFDIATLTDHVMNSITAIGSAVGAELPERDSADSLEFLVHAWDYAMAMGQRVNAPDSLTDYVMGLAQNIITPQGRTTAGFDDPIEVPADAGALDRLVAYTGRDPRG